MNQRVSIVTPMYNAKKYIEQTILSVQSQTYEDWEMLIIDDGSTDDSVAIVESYISKDERIKLLKNSTNRGVAETRNVGIMAATGRYLAFLDSDDLWKPQKLERQMAFMEMKETPFSFTACGVIDENGEVAGPVRRVPETIAYKQLLKGNAIPCLTVMADTQQIPKELLCMPSISHEDYATWLRVARQGYAMSGLNEVLASYRTQVHSLSGNKFQAAKWQWAVYRKQEGLTIVKSLFYMLCYVRRAVWKRIK